MDQGVQPASSRDPSDAARMSQLRNDWLIKAVDDELAGLKLVQGKSATPRKFERHWGDDEPPVMGVRSPVDPRRMERDRGQNP